MGYSTGSPDEYIIVQNTCRTPATLLQCLGGTIPWEARGKYLAGMFCGLVLRGILRSIDRVVEASGA